MREARDWASAGKSFGNRQLVSVPVKLSPFVDDGIYSYRWSEGKSLDPPAPRRLRLYTRFPLSYSGKRYLVVNQ